MNSAKKEDVIKISKKFFRDIFNKGNIKDYFKRNKFYLLLSLILVLLSFYSGFSANSIPESNTLKIFGFVIYNPNLNTVNGLLTYNSIYSAVVIITGFLISIPSILLSVSSTANMGTIFVTNSSASSVISAMFGLFMRIFALLGAFLVTKMELRFISALLSNKKKSVLKRIKPPLKDIILTLVFVIIFIIITSFTTPL